MTVRRLVGALAVVASVCATAGAWWPARVVAQAVFAGDPVDPSNGAPYAILPGVPLVYPGADGRFGTADDLVDTASIGDVDLVIRTAPVLAGGVIPAPAPGVAAAPTVTAGGRLGGVDSQVPFYVVLSDGIAPPTAGTALLGPELDLRRALIVAYADLDGDGFVGPTATSAAADVEVRRQEALTMAGRAMAELHGGVASGQIGVSLGLPASVGGLGVVLGAGAATGATPNLYADGPWVATSLPYMIPLDQASIVGGEPTGPVDPVGLVDLELSGSKIYLPAPNDPRLGTPYAIPLDGSAATVDLMRSVSGPAVGVAFAQPVDRATYVASWAHVLRPAIDAGGARVPVDTVDAATLAGDGAASALSIAVFPADLLGNAADPAAGGQSVALEVGPALRIIAPDSDGDPRRETLRFDSPRFVTVTLDDTGAPVPADVQDGLLATCDGVPCGALPLTVTAGGGPQTSGTLAVSLRHVGKPGRGVLQLAAGGQADASSDPATQDVTLTVDGPAGTIYQRTFAAGALRADRRSRRFTFRDAGTSLVVQRPVVAQGLWTARLRVTRLSLAPVGSPVSAAVQIGGVAWRDSRVCTADPAATVIRCGP